MRVAFDVTVSARVRTGVGVYARQLFDALRCRDLDMRLWQHPLGLSGPRGPRLVDGVRLATWQALGVAHRARRECISVVHATTSIGPFRVPCPVVLTIHDATTVTMPIHARLANRLFSHVFSVAAARRADVILAPTHAAGDAIAEHYGVPRHMIHVVPLGVADVFRKVTPDDVRAARHLYGLDRPYVLYVGADSPRKNIQALVRAMAVVGATHPDVELVCAGPSTSGDGTTRPEEWPTGSTRRVRRLGEVSDTALPGLYAGASCMAYVSLCEGFGLPIAEAMAAGAPVVTSDRSSMPEVAGDAAVLVDPTNVEAIADGITRVLDDSALAARLRAAGQSRSHAFTWHRTAQATEQVYRLVCGKPPGHVGPASLASGSTREDGAAPVNA